MIKSTIGLKTRMVFFILLSLTISSYAQSGRIAVVADGNTKDSDDIAATALTIAILAAEELHDKLVHYSHSCHLDPAWTGNSEFVNREQYMHESLHGAADLYGGFDKSRFFNVSEGAPTAAEHLAAQIDASSATDILWIAEAGETDVIYDAFVLAQQSKRQYVRIITHHPNNDIGYDLNKDLADILNLSGCSSSQRVEIKFQNDGLYKPKSQFYWMRDHSDERITFLWERGELAEDDQWSGMNTAGYLDYSDAGMVWWWMTGATNGGDEDSDPTKVRNLLEPYVAANDPIVTPNGELLNSFIAASDFTYTGFYIDNNADLGNLLAIDPDPNDSGNDSERSGTAEVTYNGKSGTYDLYFVGVGEKDGEAPIEVLVNNTLVGSYSIPLSSEEWELGKKYNMAFHNVTINTGDKLVVKGKTASNGGEWSRCRWQKLEIYGNKETEVVDGAWLEQNGYVVIEPEDVVVHEEGKWEINTSSTGYTGDGYIVWKGSSYFNEPGPSYISFKVKINNPGKYNLNWRNRVGKGHETSEYNDSWIQFPDAADFYAQLGGTGTKKWPVGSGKTPNPNGTSAQNYLKVYQYDKNLAWTWNTKSSDREDGWVMVEFASVGTYEIRVSPRSDYHLIDRITLAQMDKIDIATNLSTPKSPFDGEQTGTKVTGVTLTPASINISVGGTQQLSATVSPSDAQNKSVNWTSSNTSVATVNSSGLVTSVAAGSATITVRTNDGGFTDNSSITVTNDSDTDAPLVSFANPANAQVFDEPASVYVNVAATDPGSGVNNVRLYIDGQLIRQENVAPYEWNAAGQNDSVLQNMSSGTYTLMATATDNANNTNSESIVITVGTSIPVTGVTLSPTSISMNSGETSQLNGAVVPSNASNQTVIYSSNNTAVATVNQTGLVTAVSSGAATITATSDDGGFEATSTVTVAPDGNAPIVNFSQPLNGTIVNTPANVTVVVDASDSDGSVSNVKLFLNGSLVRQENVAPYEWNAVGQNDAVLQNLTVGSHTLRAVATDNDGLTGEALITVQVTDVIPVTGVDLSPQTINLEVGQTTGLNYTVLPDNASNKSVTWSSSNTTVATVDPSGNVIVISAGTATITVTTVDGGFTSTCEVNVVEPIIAPVVSFNGLGTTHCSPATLSVTVDAIDADGTVSNVRLYLNGALVRQENVAPYEWNATGQNDISLQNLQAGSYTLRAVATDNEGNEGESSIVVSIENCNVVPVIYSFSDQLSDAPATNLIDGNIADASRWSVNGMPQTVVIDYGQSISITGTRLWTYLDRAYQFTIEASNTATTGYTTIVDRTSNTSSAQPISDDVAALNARYIKITVTGASGYSGTWSALTEFEVVSPQVKSADKNGFSPITEQVGEASIYPNPCSNSLNIVLPNKHSFNTLQLVDITGRVIHNLDIENYSHLELSDEVLNSLNSGLYLIQLRGTDGAATYKIRKQ